MENEMPALSGSQDDDVVDVNEYSRTTKACHKKLQVPLAPLCQRVASLRGRCASTCVVVDLEGQAPNGVPSGCCTRGTEVNKCL